MPVLRRTLKIQFATGLGRSPRYDRKPKARTMRFRREKWL
jgi:hypothetical protein